MRWKFFEGPDSTEFGRHPGRGGRGRRFKRGVLKYVLLKLLDEQARHGYDLMRTLREKGWPGGAGSIYPLLASLEADGLIAGRDEGDRRTYQITEKGRRHLEENGNSFFPHGLFHEFFHGGEEAEGPEEQAGGELREAAQRLMQAISQLSSSKPETVERVRELLDRTRKEIYSLLAQE